MTRSAPAQGCQAGPADKWVIGEGGSGVPGPRGSPLAGWLAGSSPPAPPPAAVPSPSQAGRRQQIPSHHLPRAAAGNLSYAKRLQIRASQPQTGRLYLLRHRWKAGTNQPVEKKKKKTLPAGYVTSPQPGPRYPPRLLATLNQPPQGEREGSLFQKGKEIALLS